MSRAEPVAADGGRDAGKAEFVVAQRGRRVELVLRLKLVIVMVSPADTANLGEGGFADSGEVRIHYVTKGTGPLVVLVHGIPGFWYDWRHQIPALAQHFQVVAIDQRGFNLSDQPEGVENYTLDKLVGDVDAIVQRFGREKVTLVGHDSGAWISWHYAMTRPDKIERLVIVNLPHPRCIERELANNPRQYEASDYARQLQHLPPGGRILVHEGVAYEITPEGYALGFKDEHQKYVAALRRTSIEAMINFYKANYPRPPYKEQTYPPVKCPVLMIHGLDDIWLIPEALNDTWRYLEKDLTLVTVPKAGHWVHLGPVQALGAPDLVTQRMVSWLTQE
jgi:pimeloyl-ACP methyl ester carboxylesterase